jgi:hypothetical protein
MALAARDPTQLFLKACTTSADVGPGCYQVTVDLHKPLKLRSTPSLSSTQTTNFGFNSSLKRTDILRQNITQQCSYNPPPTHYNLNLINKLRKKSAEPFSVDKTMRT